MKKQNKKKRKKVAQAAAQDQASESKPRNGNWMTRFLVVGLTLALAALGVQYVLRPATDLDREQFIERSEQAIDRGNWGGLEAIAREWAELDPGNPQPWDYAAQAAMQLGSPELAADYLKEALPNGGVDIYQKLGFIQMEFLNDPLGTKATCDQTIAKFPDDSQTHERLLFYYTMTCQRNEVVEEAVRAIGEGCDTLATYAYLVSAKWMTFTNGYETNLKWLQAAPEEELFEVAAVLQLPSYPRLDELAREVVEPGSEPRPLEYAASRVRTLRDKYPENVQLLAIETRDLCRAGDVRAVGERLAKIGEDSLLDNRFWRFKGWFHNARQEYLPARQAYEKAIELNPFDWATRVELATLLRTTEGIEASKEVQKLADTGKQLMFAIQDCPNLHLLEPASIYDDLIAYFKDCGQEDLANGLTLRLQEAGR